MGSVNGNQSGITLKTHDLETAHLRLEQIVDHIVERHHQWLRDFFPLILHRLEQASQIRSRSGWELARLLERTVRFRNDMMAHMLLEEQKLFPVLRQMDQKRPPPDALRLMATSLERVMEEHQEPVTDLAAMVGRDPGEMAQNADTGLEREIWRLFTVLQDELREHKRMEDEVLFPRALRALAGDHAA